MAEPPSPWASPGDEPDASSPPAGDTRAGAGGPAGSWGPPPAAAPGGQQWGGQQWGGQQWGAPPPPGSASGAGRPAIVPLRPLTVGDIFDGSIRAIRANPRTMVGFSAVVIAVLTLLTTAPQAFVVSRLANSPLADSRTAQTADLSDIADLAGAGGLAALAGIVQLVLATTIITGLLIVAVDGAVRGWTPTPAQLWARCRSRLLAVLGLAVVVVLALPLLFALALAPGVAVLLNGSDVLGGILLVVGAIIAVIAFPALYFGFWSVAAPALLLEDRGVFAALRRSRQLVRRSFWRVFGIGLLTIAISGTVRAVFEVPFGLVGSLVTGSDTSFTGTLVQVLIGDVGTVLAGAVVFPFSAGVTALLYLDLRIRSEGLDVDLMRS